jgi:hypothetical protein
MIVIQCINSTSVRGKDRARRPGNHQKLTIDGNTTRELSAVFCIDMSTR